MSRLLSSRVTRLIILIAVVVAFALMIVFLRVPLPAIELSAEPVFPTQPIQFLGFDVSITNTLIASWMSMFILLVFAFFATRKMKLVPSGLQNLAELIIETAFNFCQNIARERTAKFFPWVMTIFLWVLVSNWMGLVPGFNSIGYVHEMHGEKAGYKADVIDVGPVRIHSLVAVTADEKAHETGYALVPFFRSVSSDLSFTVTLAIISVVMTQVFGLQALGWGYINRFIPFKSLWGLLGGERLLMGSMDLIVGPLEAISEAAKIISFSFRLFGNVFAGEVLLGVLAFLVPYIVPLPFYGLEIFVGAMQAFVFGILTLLFMTGATTAHSEEGH